MKIFSNQPGLQLYTGHKLNFKSKRKKLSFFQGLCLETQHFPNSPNQKDFPTTLAIPNKKYRLFKVQYFIIHLCCVLIKNNEFIRNILFDLIL